MPPWLAGAHETPPIPQPPPPLIEVVSWQVGTELLKDPAAFARMSPGEFQEYIPWLLERRLDYEIFKTGHVNRPDGGVDFIARPKHPVLAGFLIAGQVKHHKGDQKTGSEDVQKLMAWAGGPFHRGLLVANTEFTDPARYAATRTDDARRFLQLRDGKDIERWSKGDFSQEGREVPPTIPLTPGVTIELRVEREVASTATINYEFLGPGDPGYRPRE